MTAEEKISILGDLVADYEIDYVLRTNEEWSNEFLDLIKKAVVKYLKDEFKKHATELFKREDDLTLYKKQLRAKYNCASLDKLVLKMTERECADYKYKYKRLNDLRYKATILRARIERLEKAW